MSTELARIEKALMPDFGPVLPTFEALLPPEVPAQTLMRTIMVSCLQTPKLMDCMRQTLVNSALSAACLGLQCDGVAGQGYLVPYKKRAQFLVGYKGYITIAARSGYTLEGFAVLEGDGFEFDEANGVVQHRRVLGGERDRRPIAFYAIARRPGHATYLRVLSDDQVRATRDESDGYKNAMRYDKSHPWTLHYAAMGMKTAQRMLAKALPMLTMQQAAALETQHDLGHAAYVEPDGAGGLSVRLDDEPAPSAPAGPSAPDPSIIEGELVPEPADEAPWVIIYPPIPDKMPAGGRRGCDDLATYERKMLAAIGRAGEHLAAFKSANEETILGPVRVADEAMASRLIDAFAAQE